MKARLLPSLFFAVLGLLASVGTRVGAQEARLEWLSSGASTKIGYYMPQRLALSATRPAGVKKVPADVTAPIFGEVSLGPKESPRRFLVLVDESAGGAQRLWVDANGNGDLTDDPPVTWSQRNASTTYGGEATVTLPYGADKRELQISMYRFDPKARADAKTMLLYYRQWGYAGEVTLGGKTYKAMIDDAKATGDFRGAEDEASSYVFLLLDVNGDGKFDSRSERFDVRKPFNIAGTTYELAGLTASGKGLKIAKSDKTVEATKPAAALIVGGKPAPFTAKLTDGRSVRFPDDYKGKVVLLDFWATWCAPCRAELPNLKKVYEEFHAQGFEILGVSLDNEASVKKLGQFTKDNGMTWPQIADGKFWDAEIGKLYGVHSIPTCILVNGSTGLITALTAESRGAGLRPSVVRALGKSAAAPATSTGLAGVVAGPVRTPSPGDEKFPSDIEHASTTDPLIEKAATALKARQLMPSARLVAARQSPAGSSVQLAAPATKELGGREIARLARESYLRVGWYYTCTKCNRTHTKLAGGYAVAPDAIATAWHVMTPPTTMKEGHVLAVDGAGDLVPVTGVIAADERMDAIVLRAGTQKLKPLALANAEVGDAAYCFSDPLKQRNYFSAGIVNRFRLANDNGGKPADASDTASLRVNVSTDWGPGSSGAAVLDTFGNVIGHVATITSLKGTNTSAYMTLHDAIPAKSVRTLLLPAGTAAR